MAVTQLLTSVGLALDILGASIIIWRSAKKYLISLFSVKAKEDIENEAIAVAFNRLSSDEKQENLSDPYVQGFISTYKSSFFGFVLLILGFIFQLLGAMLKPS